MTFKKGASNMEAYYFGAQDYPLGDIEFPHLFPASGEKLRLSLKEQGSFEGMETQVKRWQQKVSTKQTNSAWVTKAWLMADRHWTKPHP